MPSLEYAIVFVPLPTATHWVVPFQATPFPLVKNGPDVVFHEIPSLEYAIVDKPDPNATTLLP